VRPDTARSFSTTKPFAEACHISHQFDTSVTFFVSQCSELSPGPAASYSNDVTETKLSVKPWGQMWKRWRSSWTRELVKAATALWRLYHQSVHWQRPTKYRSCSACSHCGAHKQTSSHSTKNILSIQQPINLFLAPPHSIRWCYHIYVSECNITRSKFEHYHWPEKHAQLRELVELELVMGNIIIRRNVCDTCVGIIWNQVILA